MVRFYKETNMNSVWNMKKNVLIIIGIMFIIIIAHFAEKCKFYFAFACKASCGR